MLRLTIRRYIYIIYIYCFVFFFVFFIHVIVIYGMVAKICNETFLFKVLCACIMLCAYCLMFTLSFRNNSNKVVYSALAFSHSLSHSLHHLSLLISCRRSVINTGLLSALPAISILWWIPWLNTTCPSTYWENLKSQMPGYVPTHQSYIQLPEEHYLWFYFKLKSLCGCGQTVAGGWFIS